ncbi:MAG TPA: hypothetical protein VF989_17975 [Polyangiaceae bacterium]
MSATSSARLCAAVAVGAILSVLSAARARAEPGSESRASAAALVMDLRRIVDSETSVGWFVDAAAFESVHADVMESVCRATPEARRLAEAWLAAEAHLNGDARKLYTAAGNRVTDRVERALTSARLLGAMRIASRRAASDCPFWVEPSAAFRGRQLIRDHAVLALETGGVAQLRYTEKTVTLGAGGAARLLAGYGFGGRVTLLGGIEFGGGAMLRPNTEPTEFVVNYFPALPLLVRLHRLAWHYDVEVAPVAVFQADDGDFSYGLRGGFTVGVSALRTRGILPWAGVGTTAEYYFASGGREPAAFVRAGLRVGALWDP